MLLYANMEMFSFDEVEIVFSGICSISIFNIKLLQFIFKGVGVVSQVNKVYVQRLKYFCLEVVL